MKTAVMGTEAALMIGRDFLLENQETGQRATQRATQGAA